MENTNQPIEIDALTIAEVEQLILSTLLAIKKELSEKHAKVDAKGSERLFATSVSMSKARNDVGTAKYMRFAAMQGHVKAQFYLGMMFAKGSGLPQSVYHAYTWLCLSESQGSIEAVEIIGKLQPLLQAKQITDTKKQAADLYKLIHENIFNNEKTV